MYFFLLRKIETVAESQREDARKSVIGRWLKDLRTGHRDGKEQNKVRHPLGRTLSVNAKDKDPRKKLGRTLSANHKDREKYDRFEKKKCGSCERKSFREKEAGKIFTNGEEIPRPFYLLPRTTHFSRLENFREATDPSFAINPDALVSYLDEEGLNAIQIENRRRRHIKR